MIHLHESTTVKDALCLAGKINLVLPDFIDTLAFTPLTFKNRVTPELGLHVEIFATFDKTQAENFTLLYHLIDCFNREIETRQLPQTIKES